MKEGFLTVSFKELGHKPKPQRARQAIRYLKKALKKHLRKDPESITITSEVNEFIWKKGIHNLPTKIEVNVVEKDGIARIYLKEGKLLGIEKALEKESKEKKKTAKKEEKKVEKPKEKTDEELKKEKELQEKKAKEKMAEKLEMKRK